MTSRREGGDTPRPAGHARLISLAAWRGVGELYNSEGLTHAASIAYYTLLSFFPMMLLGLSILGEMTSDAADRDAAVRFVFRYFPRQFGFISGQLDAFQTQPVTFGFGGIVALVWASLGVFNAITSAVNHAWAVEKRRSFLKHRLVGFLMMVSAALILMLGLVIASLVRLAETRLGEAFVRSPWLDNFSGVFASYLATLLLIGCVALVFYYIPNTKVRFRDVWPGAILVGVLWRRAAHILVVRLGPGELERDSWIDRRRGGVPVVDLRERRDSVVWRRNDGELRASPGRFDSPHLAEQGTSREARKPIATAVASGFSRTTI